MDENANPNATPAAEPKGSMGPLVGSIIVIVILVIGAIYFWGEKLNTQEPIQETPAAPALSQSDDVDSLETDLQNTPDVQADIENL